MAAKPEQDNPDTATEAKPTGRKKLLLLGAGLALLIVLSVTLTTVIFSSMQPDPATGGASAPADTTGGAPALAPALAPAAHKTELAELQVQVKRQAEAIARLEEEVSRLRQSSAARQLQDVLANQERSFQQFLAAMKEGMHDIANMVRGSRTWLEHYESRLDKIIAQSQARAEALARDTQTRTP